ncbi:MAG: DUF3054 domain-containing protein [Ilumatobacteraceae bacterium]
MTAQAPRALALDIAAVVVFVVIGRRSHHEDGAFLPATLKVAAPFLIALAVAWIIGRGWRRAPWDPWTTGIPVWLVTVVGGVVLRRFAFDRSTAMAFILVASITLGAFLVGWRALATWWISRSS